MPLCACSASTATRPPSTSRSGMTRFALAREAAEDAWSRRRCGSAADFSFPTPDDFLVDGKASLTTCDITSRAVDGLREAREAMVTCSGAVLRVHLLLSGEATGLRIDSDRPAMFPPYLSLIHI